jgi:hypothetical protein
VVASFDPVAGEERYKTLAAQWATSRSNGSKF